MTKVGILTLPNFMFFNYGGVLQNFALFTYLKNYGYDVSAIHCNANTLKGAFRLFVHDDLHVRILKVDGKIQISPVDKENRERTRMFDVFMGQNMDIDKYSWFSKKTYDSINQKYKKVIVGSDQVWNPNFLGDDNVISTYFLDFLPDEKRISYAASFGIPELPESVKRHMSESLNHFSGISVREDSGADIVRDLTGIEAEILVDPTLLLSKEDYQNVSRPHLYRLKNADKPYILTYFLGEKKPEVQKEINAAAARLGANVFNLASRNDRELFVSGPAEFIDLFEHAAAVFTDSFHACVFSIIFEHPFVVYNRSQKGMEQMGSRIDTLLRKLDLPRISAEDITSETVTHCDYTNAYSRLNDERNAAFAFLRAHLGDPDD